MNQKIKTVEANADNKEQVINSLQSEGYSVVGIEELRDRSDNAATTYRIKGKNFNAKLGHVDREFID